MPADLSMPKPRQTAQTAQNPDALLKIGTVAEVTGLSGATIYRKVQGKRFPAPVKNGARCTRWVAGQVTAWLRQQAGAQ